jgi:hypothetical protein
LKKYKDSKKYKSFILKNKKFKVCFNKSIIQKFIFGPQYGHVILRKGLGLMLLRSAGVGGEFEDIHRHLEAVLQGVPEGMWSCIQDEGDPGAVCGSFGGVVDHGPQSSGSGCNDD